MSEGVNASERYLAGLCRSTFLRLWSYPNLFRAQQWGAGQEGKEFCDHTVVFGKHVILFSDKSVGFSAKVPLHTAWNRWFKTAVWKSANQLRGAERWLREFPDQIFEDSACSRPLTAPLPPLEQMKVHRVAVARGASGPCVGVLGGPGSLMIDPGIRDRQHFKTTSDFGAFKVGILGAGESEFVHVFDDFSLEVVLRTLDTIADFVRYLELRCALILSGKLAMAEGEEELLGLYLQNIDETGEHVFQLPDVDGVVIGGGIWSSFASSPDRRAQLEANKVSYIWDGIIDHFTEHLLGGTLQHGGETEQANVERALRTMAAANRTERRTLSKALTGILRRGKDLRRASRVFCRQEGDGCVYVFLSLHPDVEPDLDTYRKLRLQMLEDYCLVAKLKFPEEREVLGIASEPFDVGRGSEDLLYIGPDEWTEEVQGHAEEVQREMGLLENSKRWEIDEFEYPLAHQKEMQKGRNRNRPCPCGSGHKFKKCCGR